MKSQKTIPGFSVRKDHQTALKIHYMNRILTLVVPLVLLMVIDISRQAQLLVPFLLLVPVLDLRNQIRIWYNYIKRLGMPNLRACWKMWQLDAHRGYDPRTNSISREERGHVFPVAAGCLVIAGLLCLLWTKTGFASFLFPAVVLAVMAMKGLVRRARPPAVLFLAASGRESSSLQLRIWKVVYPLEVVSCLSHEKTVGGMFETALHFVSFRVGDNSTWKEMVASLIQLSPIVVIDIRSATESVQFEINLALERLVPDQVFFVGTKPDQERIPPSRCFTETGLIESLRAKLNKEVERQLVRDKTGINVYRDKRNGYFMFVPPAGWRVYEYPDPRTKVAFSHPVEHEIFLRFIVREAPGENYHAMIQADKERARQVEAMGVLCKIEESEFLGMKCSEIMAEYPKGSGISKLRTFLTSGLLFNIQYSAPTRAMFDEYADQVMRSLGTIQILEVNKGTQKKAIEQHIANRVRLAELYADFINRNEARQILLDEMNRFPDNQLIQDTMEDLRRFDKE